MRPFNAIVSILTALCLLMAPEAFGRPGSDYAATSVLAEGKWVKISTDEAGIYQITDEQLAAWGFSDPSKVKLFGYGGLVIDELFANDDNYIDDLPQIPLWRHDGKLYFYSTGTTRWTFDKVNLEFTQRLHPYSTHAYYFLTDREIPAAEMPLRNGIPTGNESTVSTYDAYTVHEQELVSVGKTGQNFFGESFTQTAEQDFTFRGQNQQRRGLYTHIIQRHRTAGRHRQPHLEILRLTRISAAGHSAAHRRPGYRRVDHRAALRTQRSIGVCLPRLHSPQLPKGSATLRRTGCLPLHQPPGQRLLSDRQHHRLDAGVGHHHASCTATSRDRL